MQGWLIVKTALAAALAATVGIWSTALAVDVPGGAPAPAGASAVNPANVSNQFMVDLYGKLAAKKGNLFFSPYSVSSALTLLERGARGKTADEMRTMLHLPLAEQSAEDKKALDAAYSALITNLQADNAKRGYQLSVANAIWTQNGESFQPAFLDDATKVFHAGVEGMNFITEAESARAKINTWVAKQTNDKIKDLMPADSITPATRLVITNAVYFKGEWASKFAKPATQREDFYVGADKAADKAVQADLMHQKHRFGYFTDDKCQALELPYKGNELAMLVLLPVAGDHDCGKLESAFSADYVRGLVGKLRGCEVNVTLPKWKFTLTYGLNQPLQELGMKDAFGPAADFSGINGRKDLMVTAVVHKAFIDVNEESTEAAGATGIAVGRAMALPAEPPVEFRADRPFVYLIFERASKAILFAGRLADPTEK